MGSCDSQQSTLQPIVGRTLIKSHTVRTHQLRSFLVELADRTSVPDIVPSAELEGAPLAWGSSFRRSFGIFAISRCSGHLDVTISSLSLALAEFKTWQNNVRFSRPSREKRAATADVILIPVVALGLVEREIRPVALRCIEVIDKALLRVEQSVQEITFGCRRNWSRSGIYELLERGAAAKDTSVGILTGSARDLMEIRRVEPMITDWDIIESAAEVALGSFVRVVKQLDIKLLIIGINPEHIIEIIIEIGRLSTVMDINK